MKKVLKNIVMVALLTAVVCAFSACGDKEFTSSKETGSAKTEQKTETKTDAEQDTAPEDSNKVQIEMENGGKIVIELYPEYAPETVKNFKTLVSDGFYDGLTFHRVVDDFMAQGGDPLGTGMGGSEKTIKGEFAQNGFAQNTLSHTRGVISMARSQDPDSASSQFFICYSDDCKFLDGQYAAFGKVVEGMNVVDGFLKVERKANNIGEKASPVKPIVMKKVTLLGK